MRKIYFVLINFQHLEFIYSLHGIWVVIWIIHTHFYTFLHRQWIRNDIKHDIILRASFVSIPIPLSPEIVLLAFVSPEQRYAI